MHHVEIEVSMRIDGMLVRQEKSVSKVVDLTVPVETALKAASVVRDLNARLSDEDIQAGIWGLTREKSKS